MTVSPTFVPLCFILPLLVFVENGSVPTSVHMQRAFTLCLAWLEEAKALSTLSDRPLALLLIFFGD